MSERAIAVDQVLDLLETNKRLVALGEKQKMLDFVLDQAVRLSGAERGFVIFRKGGDCEVAAARSFDREDLKKADDKFSQTVLKEVMETGKALLTMDAGEDRRLKGAPSVMRMKLRSILCVPVRIADRPLGALYLDNRFTEKAFQEDQVRVVSLFADQAALALNAIDSLEEARRHAEEMERLQRQLSLLNETLEEKAESARAERDRVCEMFGVASFREGFEGIVGNSKPIREIFKTIVRLKDSEAPVFLHGESGTGKEVFARAIHRNSPRRDKPFLGVNCAAFSEQVLDSEFFGHVRGAFTGADRDRRGLFEEASGGTLFLDEVGEMSPGMQAKLLRVLQEKEIRPVGSNLTKKVDVRVVSASIRDLQKMVREGGFREDLYYRLHVVRIGLPPLRDRPEDIPDLVRHFLKNNPVGLPAEEVSVDPDAMKLLVGYSWPGNIRELQNEIHRGIALGKGRITAGLLSPEILEHAGESDLPPTGLGLDEAVRNFEKKMILRALEEREGNKSEASEALQVSRMRLYQKMRQYGLSLRHGRADARKIWKVLREVGGNRTLAAKRLGVTRKTLYNRLKENS
ncbi:MAG TPA: sigma 54-interacting transcriptional regulator [bacterium]|nr:sigma 54-interacting transcriptional regulator [bacterium]